MTGEEYDKELIRRVSHADAAIRYNRANVKQVKMNLNLRTDADIIGYLSGKDNVQGYIKELIRNNMKEDKTMASRVYYRGHEVGEVSVNEAVLAYTNGSDFTDDQITESISSVREKIHEALESLDNRLWWQPETSEVFWEDDGSGRHLPFDNDPESFIEWWNETISGALETI